MRNAAVLLLIFLNVACSDDRTQCVAGARLMSDHELILEAVEIELELVEPGPDVPGSAAQFVSEYPACCTVWRDLSRFRELDPDGRHRQKADELGISSTVVVQAGYPAWRRPGQRVSATYWFGACGEYLHRLRGVAPTEVE